MKPQVSLVFPTYNREAEVIQSLALFRETLTIPYEVLIIDNSESPHQYQLAANEHQIPSGGNLGTFARNIGIDKAGAPFICMLDDDSHPLKGSLEHALELLTKASKDVVGINARVERLDGGVENPPLLPTAFHGCGTLFRSNALKSFRHFYPDNFCFYGEEYWSTLLLYSRGWRLHYANDFRICHRMSSSGRDKAKILYRLTLNNRRTWRPFVPEAFLEKVIYDTSRRYELIAEKEQVADAYRRAMAEPIEHEHVEPLTAKQFEAFSLLDLFSRCLAKGEIRPNDKVLLCSCGKFPSLWADFLAGNHGCQVAIADFNSGLVGASYGQHRILSEQDALSRIRDEQFRPIVGHSSRFDSRQWRQTFRREGIPFTKLDIEELDKDQP